MGAVVCDRAAGGGCPDVRGRQRVWWLRRLALAVLVLLVVMTVLRIGV